MPNTNFCTLEYATQFRFNYHIVTYNMIATISLYKFCKFNQAPYEKVCIYNMYTMIKSLFRYSTAIHEGVLIATVNSGARSQRSL
jgi:hypothetical protein